MHLKARWRALIVAVLALVACRRHDDAVASLWFGGDTHLGTRLRRGLFGRPLAPLRGAVGVVNLEGPLEAQPPPASARRLTSATSLLASLRRSGVRVATVANNHARDLGVDGLAHTIEALRDEGIAPAGGPAGDVVLLLGGRRVVIAPRDLSGGVPADLRASLVAARSRGELLVASFHVTARALYLPTATLREAADVAVAAGARVVVAHGTHAVAPVERRGDAVVAWGLGNLVFDCTCTRDTEAMLLRVDIRGARIDARVIPVDAGLDGAPATLAREPEALYDLFDTLHGAPLRRDGAVGWF